MTKKAFSSIVSFTPVFDHLIDEFRQDEKNKHSGVNVALVFGRVWRYAQANGECWASHSRIANDLDLSTRTVSRCLKLLVDGGYIFKDYRYGQTNLYRIAPRAIPETPRQSDNLGQSDRGGRSDSHGGRSDSHGGYDRLTDKDTKQETIKETNEETTTDDVVRFLEEIGMSKDATIKLIKDFKSEKIIQAIDVARVGASLGQVEYKPGYVRRFLEGNWEVPGWYVPDTSWEGFTTESWRRSYVEGEYADFIER